MKERTIIKGVVALLASIAILFTGNTDLIYLMAAVLLFSLCIAYAEWCERL